MRKSRAVNPDGTPTWATDERDVLLDVTNVELEMMAKAQPGLGAEYLAKRRQQLDELADKEREERDKEDHITRYLEAGGSSGTAAEEDYRRYKNEQAAAAARAHDEAAYRETTARIRSQL